MLKISYLFKALYLFVVIIFSLTACEKVSPPNSVVQEAPKVEVRDKNSIDLMKRVKRLRLENGMTILLLKREGAPIFSAAVRVIVGNVEEEDGSYGLAHFFEHMAFKGTKKVGTKDFEKEKIILEGIEKTGSQLVDLFTAGKTDAKYNKLKEKLRGLQKQAEEIQLKNEFVEIFQRNGGFDVNAQTSNDFTVYTVSLPSSKLELWAYLESMRLAEPILRGFFKEVDVVLEERRMRVDNSPNGLLIEKFLKTAFDKSNPYHEMVIGPSKDIAVYTPQKAKTFFQKYYTPSRIVLAVVGNFDMDQAENIMNKYFGAVPAGTPVPLKEKTAQVTQHKEFPRKVILEREDRPRFYLAYHRPSYDSPDDLVLDYVQEILCGGRTSRLYKKLVLEEKKAAAVTCYAAFPGFRMPTLFTFYAMPYADYSNEALKKDIEKEINKLIVEGPTKEEMQQILNKLDANLIYSLESNKGLAAKLTFFEALTGRWEYLYDQQKQFHQVTPADIQRVAKKYFVPEGEVMGALETSNK
ncbi:MAG: pitrilysin family protein [bacterium]|nr:insulinase family protein [bacterium]MBU1918235.1 insulinase family protein [bacterium]